MIKKEITADDIRPLCAGAAFLATGGGGDPYVAQLVSERLLREFGPAQLIAPKDLDDDAFIVSVGSVGAPTVTLEQLPSADRGAHILEQYEKLVGRKIDAVIPFEVGGGNSTIPLYIAAAKGIPCVDGDGMGRALPEAQMMTFPIYGVKPTPAVIVDPFGNSAVLNSVDVMSFERQIRAMAVVMGGMVISAEHGMTGAQAKYSAVPHTISFAVELGKLLLAHGGEARDIERDLAALFAASDYGRFVPLYEGKVVDSQRKIIGGYDVGEATIEAFDSSRDPMTLTIKNEYLVAKVGDKVVATVPDLICVLEKETSRPMNAERMRYGQRVSVYGIGCTHHYKTPEALAVVAPKAFGLDCEYLPL